MKRDSLPPVLACPIVSLRLQVLRQEVLTLLTGQLIFLVGSQCLDEMLSWPNNTSVLQM